MPNLYFCQPHARNQGMLRAVLSFPECQKLVSRRPATYIGEQFPKVAEGVGGGNDFALLSVGPNEIQADWQAGYYKLESDLDEVNEMLGDLTR